MTAKHFIYTYSVLMLMNSCSCDKPKEFVTTPYKLSKSSTLPQYPVNKANNLTKEGVLLGKTLFYDEILSGDNTMSCNTCHLQENAFATNKKIETGIDGSLGRRNSMGLSNLIWANSGFFWDGRAKDLKTQVQLPVEDPVEMHETWSNAISEIKSKVEYHDLFKNAFNIESKDINQEYVADALTQFIKTLVSGNSKYDKYIKGEVDFTDDELAGLTLFRAEGPENGVPNGGDCFHCHVEPLFTDFKFRNNGLDEEFTWKDLGLYEVTKQDFDKAKFKTPSLRNIELTAPYMHDGRFNTLEEVVEHYDSGGHQGATVSALMEHQEKGLKLTALKKKQIVAFLKTLTDTEFICNPNFQE